jgi:hypothetical protein
MEKRTFFKLCLINISFILMSIGPPGIKPAVLVNLNSSDRTIAIDGTSNYIISSMQIGKVSKAKLSDGIENNTTAHIKILNQSVGYTTNDPDIIIKKNEFN